MPLLLRKVDRAGVLEVMAGEEAEALAELVKIPIEVVVPGLEGLQKRGVVVVAAGKLQLPTFLAAQSAKQSDKIRQQKSRELAAIVEGVSHGVTRGHTVSQDVTLSLAVPSLAVPLTTSSISSTEKVAPKAKSAEKLADPRHAPLRSKLMEAFRGKRGADLPWAGRQGKTLQRLLDQRAKDDLLWPITLLAAFERALLATHPDLKSLEDFERDLLRYIGTGPPTKDAKPDWLKERNREREYVEGPVKFAIGDT